MPDARFRRGLRTAQQFSVTTAGPFPIRCISASKSSSVFSASPRTPLTQQKPNLPQRTQMPLGRDELWPEPLHTLVPGSASPFLRKLPHLGPAPEPGSRPLFSHPSPNAPLLFFFFSFWTKPLNLEMSSRVFLTEHKQARKQATTRHFL